MKVTEASGTYRPLWDVPSLAHFRLHFRDMLGVSRTLIRTFRPKPAFMMAPLLNG